jgi:hypothetical protein
MTNAQHAETVALLAGLVKQGDALRKDIAELTGLCGTLEALIHGVNMRFDEL